MSDGESPEWDTRDYLRQRAMRHAISQRAFLEDPTLAAIVVILRDSLTDFAYGFSGQDWSTIRHGDYYVGLVAAYVRTHGTVVDLTLNSEVIDGASLLRRQFELIARLYELDRSDNVSKLIGRTPNLRVLKSSIPRAYGEYSQIYHSSARGPFDLLGSGDGDNSHLLSMFPKFGFNSRVLLQNAAIVHLEFLVWAKSFLPATDLTFDLRYIDGPLQELSLLLADWNLQDRH